ncbi:MAG: hypothetical protein WAV28_16630 [Sedimentisphaerales bacterium]
MKNNIENFEERLADQVRNRWTNYQKKRIDLTLARTNEQFFLAGAYLCVEDVSDTAVTATIRLNKDSNDELDLVNGVEIETLFGQFYITNAAQPGEWLDLIIGADFKYKKKGEGGGGLIGDTYVDVYRSINQSIPAGVITQVDFDTKIIDIKNEFDLTTNLFTAVSPGDYLLIVCAKLAAIDNTKRVGIYPVFNGVIQEEINFMASATSSIGAAGSLICTLAAGNTLELEVWHNCTSAKNLLGGLGRNRLQVYRLK